MRAEPKLEKHTQLYLLAFCSKAYKSLYFVGALALCAAICAWAYQVVNYANIPREDRIALQKTFEESEKSPGVVNLVDKYGDFYNIERTKLDDALAQEWRVATFDDFVKYKQKEARRAAEPFYETSGVVAACFLFLVLLHVSRLYVIWLFKDDSGFNVAPPSSSPGRSDSPVPQE